MGNIEIVALGTMNLQSEVPGGLGIGMSQALMDLSNASWPYCSDCETSRMTPYA